MIAKQFVDASSIEGRLECVLYAYTFLESSSDIT